MSLFLRRRMLIAKSKTKKSKNLFNINSYGEYVDTQKTPYIDVSKYNVGETLTISSNTEYMFKIAKLAGDTAVLQNRGKSLSFKINENIKNNCHLYIISTKTWATAAKEELIDKEVQLEYGNEATPYEPYN